jgi:hypothetical protein
MLNNNVTLCRRVIKHKLYNMLHSLYAPLQCVVLYLSRVLFRYTLFSCIVDRRSINTKAHLEEIVRCSFKLKLDLGVISSLSNLTFWPPRLL